MRPSSFLHRTAHVALDQMDKVLEQAYGTPERLLGNQDDPLDEAIYIILSSQTNLTRFRETWSSLRSRFPQWEDVQRASVSRVARVLRGGGLHVQKARTIKRLLASVRKAAGELSLDSLRDMPDDDACQFLWHTDAGSGAGRAWCDEEVMDVRQNLRGSSAVIVVV